MMGDVGLKSVHSEKVGEKPGVFRMDAFVRGL